MRGKVGKETPKKEIDDRRIFISSHIILSAVPGRTDGHTLVWDDLHWWMKGQQLAFYNSSVHICAQVQAASLIILASFLNNIII